MYCEEFHPACYNGYAFDYGHTNLAKTLTQEGDEYCAFNVVLRAENLPEDLKPLCFAEYDPGYVPPVLEAVKPDAKAGFETLSIKIYYYLLEAVLERFGAAGGEAIARGLEKAAQDGARRACATARAYQKALEEAVFDTYPLTMDAEKPALWADYSAHGTLERFESRFIPAFRRALEHGEEGQ